MKLETIQNDSERIINSELNAKKIIFAEHIIDFFAPLFNEEIEKKRAELEISKKDKSELELKIVKTESTIKQANNQLKKEEKIKEILSEISFLIDSDALYGQSKQLILNRLQKLETFDLQQLNDTLDEIKDILKKSTKKVRED